MELSDEAAVVLRGEEVHDALGDDLADIGQLGQLLDAGLGEGVDTRVVAYEGLSHRLTDEAYAEAEKESTQGALLGGSDALHEARGAALLESR